VEPILVKGHFAAEKSSRVSQMWSNALLYVSISVGQWCARHMLIFICLNTLQQVWRELSEPSHCACAISIRLVVRKKAHFKLGFKLFEWNLFLSYMSQHAGWSVVHYWNRRSYTDTQKLTHVDNGRVAEKWKTGQ
jgi:hypothetical protein